jgi:arylsulfatase A
MIKQYNMRRLLFCIFLFIASSAFSQKPNIIYIMCDDLGYGELGCYGQQHIKTPNIDRMAAGGMRFTRFYSAAPVCAPTRCQLLTGMHSGHAYIRSNYEFGGFTDSTEGGQMPLHEGAHTIGHMLQAAGYKTACIGKWGLGMHYNTGDPNKQGFDYFFGYYDQKQAHNFYPTHLWENGHYFPLNNPPMNVHTRVDSSQYGNPAVFDGFTGNDYAIDRFFSKAGSFISGCGRRPFFLYLALTTPHVALQAPPEAVQEYLGKFEETPYYGRQMYNPCKTPRATYAAMITYTDKKIGALLEWLRKKGMDKNTLIFFTSDNGPTYAGGVDYKFFNSAGGLRGLKGDVYEGGIRVPFIAYWPGRIKSGGATAHPAAAYDIKATLASAAGVKPPGGDGLSFFSLLTGGLQLPPLPLYFEFPDYGGQVAVIMGRYKAVKRDLIKNPRASWEVYNLETDPGETTNLAATHPEFAQEASHIVNLQHRQPHIKEWEFLIPNIRWKGK